MKTSLGLVSLFLLVAATVLWSQTSLKTAGEIETAVGIRFVDGSIQTSAAASGADLDVSDFIDQGLSDAAAFQAAIDHVCENLGGGSVYVPPGSYLVDAPLTADCPLRISGSAVDAVELEFNDLGSSFALTLDGSAAGGVRFRVENLSLRATGSSKHGILLFQGQSSVLSHLVVNRFADIVIKVDQSIHTSIENTRVFGTLPASWPPPMNSAGLLFDGRQPEGGRGGTNLRMWNNYISNFEILVEAIGANILSIGGVYEASSRHAFAILEGCHVTSVGDYLSDIGITSVDPKVDDPSFKDYAISRGSLGTFQPRADTATPLFSGTDYVVVGDTVPSCAVCPP